MNWFRRHRTPAQIGIGYGVFVCVALLLGACRGGVPQWTTTERTGEAAREAQVNTTAAPASVATPSAATAATAPPSPAQAPPTATPVPATVTPTPRPVARVEMGQYAMRKDQFSTRAVGYVENKGDAPAMRIQVAGFLIDRFGSTLAAGQTIYTRDVLPPGERAPFVVGFSPNPPTWASEKLQVHAEPFTPESFLVRLYAQGLTTEGVTGSPRTGRSEQGFVITGQVRNGGQKPAQLVTIIGILYDAEGKPLDVGQTSAQLKQIDPGQSAPFSLDFFSALTGIARYEVYAQGHVRS